MVFFSENRPYLLSICFEKIFYNYFYVKINKLYCKFNNAQHYYTPDKLSCGIHEMSTTRLDIPNEGTQLYIIQIKCIIRNYSENFDGQRKHYQNQELFSLNILCVIYLMLLKFQKIWLVISRRTDSTKGNNRQV